MATDKSKKVMLYDVQADRRAPALVHLLFLGFGAAFLVIYCTGIKSVISADIKNFPMAFRESAALTLLFTCVKVLAYFLFPYVAATWVYVPVKDFVPTRVEGELLSVNSIPADQRATSWASIPLLSWLLSWGMPVPGRASMKEVRIANRQFRVPDAPELDRVLGDSSLVGKQLAFTFGAFHRVLSIELVSSSD
jgi:hypothetical protein